MAGRSTKMAGRPIQSPSLMGLAANEAGRAGPDRDLRKNGVARAGLGREILKIDGPGRAEAHFTKNERSAHQRRPTTSPGCS